eukprot:CAMPEP_0185846288 /NCGR_PEP_ID=MMETSP1354-20130828/1981_1 /TAXON_ID=708628 /ORGANISM="Erythrolobus madagascarensis, Strain CCMP3276" /LENGTH=295 /DNA_ID=CAMNT_0028546399 /DNA_START=349 /DNA_END=1232 /DNA_ORIENTATION=-
MHLVYQQVKVQITHEVSSEMFHPDMATSIQLKALAMLAAGRNVVAAVQSHLSSAAIVITLASAVYDAIVHGIGGISAANATDLQVDASGFSPMFTQLAFLCALNLCSALYVYSALRSSTDRYVSEQQRILFTHHALGVVLAAPVGGLLFRELQTLPRDRLFWYAAGLILMAGVLFEVCAQANCVVPLTLPELAVLVHLARQSNEMLLLRTVTSRHDQIEGGGVHRTANAADAVGSNYSLVLNGADYLGNDDLGLETPSKTTTLDVTPPPQQQQVHDPAATAGDRTRSKRIAATRA